MSCDAWHELLIALLDEEIEPGEKSRLESHLEGCAGCREDLAELRATSAALRRWEPADPPADLVFVARRRQKALGRVLEGFGASVLAPAGIGAALAAAVLLIVLGQREPAPDREASNLRAELDSLRERVAQAEAAVGERPSPVGERSSPLAERSSPETATDLSPETREWLIRNLDRLVRQSESRQDAKLILAADQLARSLALQRRDDLSVIDRRLRDVQAETFEALVSTNERLDRLGPAGRWAPGEAPGGPGAGERLEPR